METARAALCREQVSKLHIGQAVGFVLPRDLAFFELVGGMMAAKMLAAYLWSAHFALDFPVPSSSLARLSVNYDSEQCFPKISWPCSVPTKTNPFTSPQIL
jgi:hypothetical protein